jgi:hypothetical protein
MQHPLGEVRPGRQGLRFGKALVVRQVVLVATARQKRFNLRAVAVLDVRGTEEAGIGDEGLWPA